jgi:hypothetical protein
VLVLVFLHGPEGGIEQLRLERRHCLLCYILKNKPHKELCIAELTSSPVTRCTLYSNSYHCASKKMKYVREHSQKAKWYVLRSLRKISGWKICELPKESCAYWTFFLQISNHLTGFHKPLLEAGSPYFTPPPPHDSTAPSGPGPPRYRGFTIMLRHATLGRTPLDE